MSDSGATESASRAARDDDRPDYQSSNRWRILGVLCLSLVLVVAANSGLNVALPTFVYVLGASQTQLQWFIDAYSLVFAGLLLPAGALGDRFGRKRALQVGLLVFAGASLWASFAAGPGQVIAARAIMGVGGALVMPATLSILTVVFPPPERGRAIAIWAGFAGAGGALGPVLSGLLLEWFWWGSVFFINVVIGVVALVAGAFILPGSRDLQGRPFDPLGALLSVGGFGGLIYGIIEGPSRGWTDPWILVGFFVGFVCLAGFVVWERSASEPMLDLAWFRNRAFTVGVGTLVLAFFAFIGVIFLVTQYFQFVLRYSPLTAGLAQLPLAAMLLLVAPRSSGLAKRFGSRRVMVCGLLALAAGLGYLAFVATPGATYLLLLPGLVLIGSGIAVNIALATPLVLSAAPSGKQGVASAVNNISQELGVSLGVAVLGSVLTALYRDGLTSTALPEPVAEQARESVGTALQVARETDVGVGDTLADAARQAFTGGFQAALAIAAIVAIVAAVAVFRLGPNHKANN